jgi:ribokinase
MGNNTIVVVGSSNTDMIIKVPRIPRPGETVLGGQFSMAAGGKGANQAVAAARAGGKVLLIARVGEDLFGEEAIQSFERDTIDVHCITRDEEAPSGIALIFVGEGGENSIAVAPGANTNLTPAYVDRFSRQISEAGTLLIQLETPLETVLRATEIAAASGRRIILNPAPARQVPVDLLQRVSILTPNETEAEVLTGIPITDNKSATEAASHLFDQGVGVVIITLGARGALVAAREKREWVPGFHVKALDTTAAGDVFNGALAVALSENESLADAVRFAHAAAAISVTRLGAQPSIPHRREIDEFLTRHKTG